MLTHEEMKAKALSNPTVRAEYERIEREEMPMLDAILKARAEDPGVVGRCVVISMNFDDIMLSPIFG